MSDMQKFDDNIIENLRMFSFKDNEQFYTNGAELVPLYRVVQILEHFKVQELVDKATPKKPNKLTYKLLLDEGWKYECPTCKCAIGINDNASDYMNEDSFCPTCSQAIDWSK